MLRFTWFLLLQEASQMQNLWKKCSLGVGPSDWFIWLWLVPIKMGRPPLQFLAPKRCGLFWKSLRCRRRNNGERLKFLPNAKKSWQPVIIGKLSVFSLCWCLEAALDSSHNWPKKSPTFIWAGAACIWSFKLDSEMTSRKKNFFTHCSIYPAFGPKNPKSQTGKNGLVFEDEG